MNTTKMLATDAELFAAALFQARVSVWQRTANDISVLIEYSGIIEKITPLSVKINNCIYRRDECEFRVDAKGLSQELEESKE